MAGQRADEQPLNAGAFRQVIGRRMSGVVVITAAHQGERRGMTVSAVASLSLDPPMIVTCVKAASSTQEVVRRASAFAVNILAEDQEHLAGLFARPGADPFLDLPCEPGITGAPILPGALAVRECQIAQEVRGGSHRVLLANVVWARASEGSPLPYFQGRFGRIEVIRDAEPYRRPAARLPVPPTRSDGIRRNRGPWSSQRSPLQWLASGWSGVAPGGVGAV